MPGLIFDFDGLIVDSERAIADASIAVAAEHGGTITYDDVGHLFGTVDADHLWDELLRERCRGLTLADLEARLVATLPAIASRSHPPRRRR